MVSAHGHGVVSHAGVVLLWEMAEYTGLVEGVADALIGTCKGCRLMRRGGYSPISRWQ